MVQSVQACGTGLRFVIRHLCYFCLIHGFPERGMTLRVMDWSVIDSKQNSHNCGHHHHQGQIGITIFTESWSILNCLLIPISAIFRVYMSCFYSAGIHGASEICQGGWWAFSRCKIKSGNFIKLQGFCSIYIAASQTLGAFLPQDVVVFIFRIKHSSYLRFLAYTCDVSEVPWNVR